jgi:hypothetical protein
MRTRYITIITIAALLCFADANAQQKKQAPKPKTAAKKPIVIKKAVAVDKKAASLAKSLPADTTSKGGGNKPKDAQNNQSLSEEIVVTTAYKPVLPKPSK